MKESFAFAMLLLSVVSTANTNAAEWPQFRGPGGQGATSEQNLPLTWSETENIAWKTELPGFGASSPVAIADRLYVTCYSGYGTDRQNTGSMDDYLCNPFGDHDTQADAPACSQLRILPAGIAAGSAVG